MKTTLDYLSEAKQRLGLKSDYALAKELGISEGSIGHYRNGRRVLDDYTAAKLAEALEIDPLEVIAAANAEREKDEKKREYWGKIFEKCAAACLLIAIFSFGINTQAKGEKQQRADYARRPRRLKNAGHAKKMLWRKLPHWSLSHEKIAFKIQQSTA